MSNDLVILSSIKSEFNKVRAGQPHKIKKGGRTVNVSRDKSGVTVNGTRMSNQLLASPVGDQALARVLNFDIELDPQKLEEAISQEKRSINEHLAKLGKDASAYPESKNDWFKSPSSIDDFEKLIDFRIQLKKELKAKPTAEPIRPEPIITPSPEPTSPEPVVASPKKPDLVFTGDDLTNEAIENQLEAKELINEPVRLKVEFSNSRDDINEKRVHIKSSHDDRYLFHYREDPFNPKFPNSHGSTLWKNDVSKVTIAQ